METKKEELFVYPVSLFKFPKNLENLYQCLRDRSDLDEINHTVLKYVSRLEAKIRIAAFSSNELFSDMTKTERYYRGDLIANEFYLNPKNLRILSDDYHVVRHFASNFPVNSAFSQEYKCNISERDLSEDESFDLAIAETLRLQQIFFYHYFSFMGQNTVVLKKYNLAKQVNEDFADWIANKASELMLERQQSFETRRMILLGAQTSYCYNRPTSKQDERKKKKERTYSMASHPRSRTRRLRMFTPKTAKLLNCEIGAEILENNLSCDDEILKIKSTLAF